ncbi:MAG: rhodanese-like domain-containing protein [Bacteroidia bacterium]|nr:rhodanese-like domain-containing protein [Bacteroidia bacterium]MCZ2277976.1 rhodanese-like domain-containing protein [Bacteroidia bacterium]
MLEITPRELKSWLDTKKDFQLIDIRETYESQIASIGGERIPMNQIVTEKEKIRTDIPVVIYCRSGSRSSSIINFLEKNFKFRNLYNLKGGIVGYAKEIDPALTIY